jgi:hypothetical protein
MPQKPRAKILPLLNLSTLAKKLVRRVGGLWWRGSDPASGTGVRGKQSAMGVGERRGSQIDCSFEDLIADDSMTAQEVRGGHYIENGTRTSLFSLSHLSRLVQM